MMTMLWFDKGENARKACDLLGVDKRRVHRIKNRENDPAVEAYNVWKGMKIKPPHGMPTHRIKVDAMLLEHSANFEAVASLAVDDETTW